mmetsp:Transcript_117/g.261  ORF Transcript_117/g.261 Transcript_117/m.261 type:complete len:229 (-) Transcript_117:317-1003(-)
MKLIFLLNLNAAIGLATFVGPPPPHRRAFAKSCQLPSTSMRSMSSTETDSDCSEPQQNDIDLEDAVKLFGRLAETYILLDPTDGKCCYNGCDDCAFRLPDGSYPMDEQSAEHPTWIPSYIIRYADEETEHESKWSSKLFSDMRLTLSKEQFVQYLTQLDYAPPLGGPYVESSAADITETAAAEALFDVIAKGKEKMSRQKMSVRIKQLSGGEDNMTWTKFQAALGLSG